MAKKSKKKPVKKVRKLKTKNLVRRKKILFKKKIKSIKKQNRKVIKKVFKKIKPAVKKTITRKIRRPAKIKKEEFPMESLFKAKIKVIGIGGGGGSIVSEIGRSLEKATFIIADTDIRALKKRAGIKYFWFGEKLTHGLGTGVNVDLAKQAALEAKDKISSVFKDQDIVIFVASLGGGLGSGATQVFAEAAKEFGGITFGIFTMPFKFEGKTKYRIAQNALKSLRKSLNVSLVIPNEKIFKIIDETTPITNAFSIVNKSLIESLESLIDLIHNPGIINIDFADLRAILKGTGNSAFLNTIEETGKNRAEKTCENIFRNPLLQNTGLAIEKILFNIAGSENLSMFEVEKISSHIAAVNSKAKIIFGISKDNKLKNKIKTTILMTGGEAKEEVIERITPVKPAKVVLSVKVEKSVEKEVAVKKIGKPTIIKIIKNKTAKVVKLKKVKIVKENKLVKSNKGPQSKSQQKEKPVSFLPVFEVPAQVENEINIPQLPILETRKMEVSQLSDEISKRTIRRSGLEIRKAEEMEEKKRIAQEKEWEIPAFLRKVKYKS